MIPNTITPVRILEYVDCPQLFLARDKFDTQYLCLLYADEPACQYVAVRISSERFASFCQRQVDLRTLFAEPEFDGEYFRIDFAEGSYVISRLPEDHLAEDLLPADGYYYDNTDNIDVTITVPRRERSLLLNLIRRHGWVAF